MAVQTIGVPCDIGDTIYKISIKNQTIKPWFVISIQKNSKEEGWIVIAKDTKNKYKYTEKSFLFTQFGDTIFLSRHEAQKSLQEYSKPKRITVFCKCNHKREIEVVGSPQYRARKLKWYRDHICPECRNIESEKAGLPLVEMTYWEYKTRYPNCDTKVGSYKEENGQKTIKVYVPLEC